MHPYRYRYAWLVLLMTLFGCAKKSPGPIDGTYNITDIKCNGAAGTGSMITPVAPDVSTFTFAGDMESLRIATAACTIDISFGVSYPSSTSLVATPNGISCNPANCSFLCTITATSTIPRTYNYTLVDKTLTLIGSTGEVSCSTAMPAQADPVTFTAEKQ